MFRVILGLGGNTGEPASAFRHALDALARDGRIAAVSRLWRTRPIGPPQSDYLNAAALISWSAGPRSLLARCRQLEAAAGRDRSTGERWGPRDLDLDLLLAEGLVCRGPILELPHPRFHERRFALEPAAEVAPDWRHPLLGLTVGQLADRRRGREPDAILEVLSFEL
ncbi:MAG TPA: 2-amino-4-hydroxy-6-hydroxymethyldihydropteridine diphosphokinase [Chondromyces sp.]|nr:2-amino-4-hydroxy-6-hydroxymethyldihydropteridine diphosphokinase [Chondromyces sp.]